eukprot:5155395-Amphidinium_carterae.1
MGMTTWDGNDDLGWVAIDLNFGEWQLGMGMTAWYGLSLMSVLGMTTWDGNDKLGWVPLMPVLGNDNSK